MYSKTFLSTKYQCAMYTGDCILELSLSFVSPESNGVCTVGTDTSHHTRRCLTKYYHVMVKYNIYGLDEIIRLTVVMFSAHILAILMSTDTNTRSSENIVYSNILKQQTSLTYLQDKEYKTGK